MRSERLERMKAHSYSDADAYAFTIEANEMDRVLSVRIVALLDHPKINDCCMVDAYYYDFSEIPEHVLETLAHYRDAYLIFGITTECEIVSKWVDRWDLDSDEPIVNGEVIHKGEWVNETGCHLGGS